MALMAFYEFIFTLFILACGIWFWYDSLRCREIATGICKQVCAQFRLQLLDDSVSISKIRLKRNQHGQLKIQRAYRFEFYDNADSTEKRHQGSLLMRGVALEMLELPGYMNRTFSPV